MRADTKVRVLQVILPVAFVAAWHVLTALEWLPPFFFGRPFEVARRLVDGIVSGSVLPHLAVTLAETLLAFVVGTLAGLACGLWLGVYPFAARVLDPWLKGLNAVPRVILAPIFAVWFGLGMTAKVLLGVTLVFFVVFFAVFHAVRDADPALVANARMLGASRRDLLRHVYLPAALATTFASLHTAIGLAFVGAVIGEYLGSARGIGYLILQAEGVFDIDAVLAGVLLLTACALVLDAVVSALERRILRWRG